MMKIENPLELLPDVYNPMEKESILNAYKFAENAHSGQKRVSGEPYITHCVAVAVILVDLKVDASAIIAGLLHDTIEDTSVTLEEVKSIFGDEVSKMVDGVTKLTKLPNLYRSDQHTEEDTRVTQGSFVPQQKPVITKRDKSHHDLRNEALRKTFTAMGEDIRIVLIKLADRLHNMRTLGYMPEFKRKKISQETLDIYAPLANRLGIWQIKWELEDLSFRYLYPEKFKEIAENITEHRSDREKQIQEIIIHLKSILEQVGIAVEITGRSKHIYSIYKKMLEKGKTFDMVWDLRGVRLIVKDVPSCYAALGVIHTHWRPIPHEFDDYIASPKDNNYQSLHTAIIYEDGKPLEVQIRTLLMHQNSEFGIAAHWRYKEKGKHDEVYQKRISWLRKTMEWRQELEDAQEFVDTIKTDAFQDRVYVFTPKGDIIELPAGSTPIDFAYHVHTEIGNRCRGAKINGKLVPLDYTLVTGDSVEILTAKQGGPSRDWINYNLGLVHTQRARSKIKQWFKRQDYDQNLSQGKAIFEKELRRLGMSDINLDPILTSLEIHSSDALFAAIGCGDISMGRIINKLPESQKEDDPLLIQHHAPEKIEDANAVTVLGLKGILTSIAHCCNPAPGDEIIGYITQGRGVTIHRMDCPNILRIIENERVIKVSWGEAQKTYPVSIEVRAYDRQGLMADISSILKEIGVNLVDVTLKVSHNLAAIKLTIEVCDINQLSNALTKIENLQNVMEAHRLKPG